MGISYLNAASHGLPDRAVLRRMIAHLDLEAMIGTVSADKQVADELVHVHENAANLLNAPKENVGFDSGTLSAWRAYVAALPKTGKRILVAPHDWGENIAVLRPMADNAGAVIEVLPSLDLDAPDLSAWQDRMSDDVAALVLPMVSSVSGLLYPIAAIGAMQRSPDTKVIVDAAQAIGQVEIDVTQLGVDALFATTRKWVRGPRQTALFWTADAKDREAIERFASHVALRLGLGVALSQVLERGVETTAEILRERSDRIRECATALGLECLSTPQSGTAAVTVAIPAPKTKAVMAALAASDVIVKWPEPNLDEPESNSERGDTKAVRIAPHVTTELDEIDAAFAIIADALS